jgi:hypothetical protein
MAKRIPGSTLFPDVKNIVCIDGQSSDDADHRYVIGVKNVQLIVKNGFLEIHFDSQGSSELTFFEDALNQSDPVDIIE